MAAQSTDSQTDPATAPGTVTGKDLKEIIDGIATIPPTVLGMETLHATVQLLLQQYFENIMVHRGLNAPIWLARRETLRNNVAALCAANPDDARVPGLLASINELLTMFDELLNNPPT